MPSCKNTVFLCLSAKVILHIITQRAPNCHFSQYSSHSFLLCINKKADQSINGVHPECPIHFRLILWCLNFPISICHSIIPFHSTKGKIGIIHCKLLHFSLLLLWLPEFHGLSLALLLFGICVKKPSQETDDREVWSITEEWHLYSPHLQSKTCILQPSSGASFLLPI